MYLSRAGVDHTRSTFWAVTKSLFGGIQTTIPPIKEDIPPRSLIVT